MRRLYIILFALILLIGSFVRLYRLGEVPNSLNWDEASWGYNAYSILKTGHDEYGKFLPLSFEAFGDYKQPVYVYLDSLSITIFGLTPFAVRFPSALFGILSLPFLWLLVFELFRRHVRAKEIALAVMAFSALSPWAIQFSRVAYEATVALGFVLMGFSLLYYGRNRKSFTWMVLGTISLAVSTYTYHSEKIIVPLLFIGFVVFTRSYWKSRKKEIGILTVIFFVLISFWLFDTRTTVRGRSVLFTAPANQLKILDTSVKKVAYESTHPYSLGTLIYNRRFIYLTTFVSNYLTHFDPKYLFLTGDDARHHAPNMGILYLMALPFILIGMYISLRRFTPEIGFIYLWFFLSPVASAITVNPPNASRNLLMAPTWDLFAGFGLVMLLVHIGRNRKFFVLFGTLIVLLFGNGIYYLHQYFIRTNYVDGKYWQYGYKEAMTGIQNEKNRYNRIIVTESVEQSYIFYLFYNHFDPGVYINRRVSTSSNSNCRVIDGMYFGNCQVTPATGDLIVSTKDPSYPTRTVRTIFDLANEKAVTFYYVK